MTPPLADALRAGWAPAPRTRRGSARRVLVVGGAGVLGSAVLERLLGAHRFDRVGVAVEQPLTAALRGLAALPDDEAAWAAFAPDTAVVVFDRERHANGRDEPFVRPQPAQLAALARRLHRCGARALVVAVPHAPSMLPHALRHGLANLDEGAVAALGFEHLVFLRMAQGAAEARVALAAPARLARWMLRQLRWMVPQAEQPVRAEVVARVVCALALAVPDAGPGTRVLPQLLVWQAAQGGDVAALVADWLAGRGLPQTRVAPPRL